MFENMPENFKNRRFRGLFSCKKSVADAAVEKTLYIAKKK